MAQGNDYNFWMQQEEEGKLRQAQLAEEQRRADLLATNPAGIKAQSDADIAKMQALAQIELENQKRTGLDKDGRPVKLEFDSLRNADGTLKSQYQLQAQPDVTADRTALDKMKSTAMSAGPSTWAQMALQQQGVNEAGARDQNAQSLAGQNTKAMNQLAGGGGFNNSNRMSLARTALRQGALGNQQVARQGMQDRASIGVQDETNKQNMLGQVQSGEMNMANLAAQNRQYKTGVDQTNLTNTLGDVTQGRMFDQNMYSEAMKAWGANKSADAQAKAGSGGKK